MKNFSVVALLAACACSAPAWAEDSTLGDIIRQAQANYSVRTGQRIEATMKTLDAAGGEKSYKLLELEQESSEGRQMLLRITGPKSHAGTAILVRESSNAADEVYLYLPQSNSLKRITGNENLTNFLGSELDLEQLTFPDSSDYHHQLLGESKSGSTPCWKILHTPKDMSNSTKKKIVSYVNTKNFATLEVDHYDRAGELLKKVTYAGHQQLEGQWRAREITIENVQTHRKTIFTAEKYKIGLKLSPKIFTLEQLRKR
jgi:hypothetical protein